MTGHNAPLYSSDSDPPPTARERTIEATINYWLVQGAPRYKLVLGIPLYGRTFTLSNSSNNNVGAAASGPGQAGQYTEDPGNLGYNEVSIIIFFNVSFITYVLKCCIFAVL